MTHGTPYFIELRREIARRGGIFNAHLHMDRSGTLEETRAALDGTGDEGMSHLSLQRKHGLIPLIHASAAYDVANLGRRVGHFLDLMEQAGTTRADTVVDVTDDRVGLSALRTFLDLKHRRRGRFDLRVGAYTPMGFADGVQGLRAAAVGVAGRGRPAGRRRASGRGGSDQDQDPPRPRRGRDRLGSR